MKDFDASSVGLHEKGYLEVVLVFESHSCCLEVFWRCSVGAGESPVLL